MHHMKPSGAASNIVFGAHVFHPATGSLYTGGTSIDLQAQPARLLALLLEHAGDVVTREDIRVALWPDTNVSFDQNINFAIRQIRVALGGDAGFIQTVPRRGYRFVGPVAHSARGQEIVTRPSRHVAAAAAVLVGLTSGFAAGIVVRDAPAGRFVYDHLVHPDRCPYVRLLLPILRNS